MYSMARVKDDLYVDKIIARNLSYPAADETSTVEWISFACVKQSVTMAMAARVAIKIRKSEMKRKHQFRVKKCLST